MSSADRGVFFVDQEGAYSPFLVDVIDIDIVAITGADDDSRIETRGEFALDDIIPVEMNPKPPLPPRKSSSPRGVVEHWRMFKALELSEEFKSCPRPLVRRLSREEESKFAVDKRKFSSEAKLMGDFGGVRPTNFGRVTDGVPPTSTTPSDTLGAGVNMILSLVSIGIFADVLGFSKGNDSGRVETDVRLPEPLRLCGRLAIVGSAFSSSVQSSAPFIYHRYDNIQRLMSLGISLTLAPTR